MPVRVPLIGQKRMITDNDICVVLQAGVPLSPTESHLLSLVMRSMIALCKAMRVDRAVMVRQIEAAWDETRVPAVIQERLH